jgi:AraC-like DNA-binding protein
VAFVSRPPAPWLAPYVERVWALSEIASHTSEVVLPTGTFELVVNLEDDEIIVSRDDVETRYSGAIVSGANTQPFAIDPRVHQRIVGVHFRPGGAAPFFGTAPAELTNRHVDLHELAGATSLRDQLCSARSTRDRFVILEALLKRSFVATRNRSEVRSAIGSLTRSTTPIASLVEASGLSHRRFIDLFTAEVGISPKCFARVSRMQRALRLARDTSAPWAELAIECGYSDQSHLIRDLRALCGMTPAQYASRRSDALLESHVHAAPSISSNTHEHRAH